MSATAWLPPRRPPAFLPARPWLRARRVEVLWLLFAAANYAAMLAWPSWETIPFHFVWISLTLVYGFRVWPVPGTLAVLAGVMGATGLVIGVDAFKGTQLWGELFEVPLMAAMFVAMVWHARRRVDALAIAEERSEQRRSALERQERFIHDASHELRTPVTIARGHIDLLRRSDAAARPELDVVLDELGRIDRILGRLLLLATADQPDFLELEEIDVEPFVEEVFLRWSEVAPRAWCLDPRTSGTLLADAGRLRAGLDALIENAVKYSDAHSVIELGIRQAPRETLVIEVRDQGCGVPRDALERIFERFARADAARTRSAGGVGLGLAIADAIAKGHGGRCTVRSTPPGSTFALRLPGFRAASAGVQPADGSRMA